MAQLAWIVASLALAGAFASWIAGAWFYARALAAERGQISRAGALIAVVAWPFALGRLKGAAAAHATKVNKALVAVLACLTVAAAATSVATNLARVSRAAANG
jgi:hypothetical protein